MADFGTLYPDIGEFLAAPAEDLAGIGSALTKAAPAAMNEAANTLVGIGSALSQATATAAAPTIDLASMAADEVSNAVSQIFAAYGLDFAGFADELQVYQEEFVALLKSSAEAYSSAEDSAARLLGTTAAELSGLPQQMRDVVQGTVGELQAANVSVSDANAIVRPMIQAMNAQYSQLQETMSELINGAAGA